MKRVDLLILAVLVAAILLSVAGALAYEDTRRARFAVDWTTTALDVEGTLEGASATEFPLVFDIDATNVTFANFTFTVSGNAARAQPVAIRVELTPPNATEPLVVEGELPAGPLGSVALPLAVPVNAVPSVVAANGASPADAAAALAAIYATTNGTGEWRAVVLLAPGLPGPLGAAETYTVAGVAEVATYAADVRPVPPEVGGR